MEKKKTNHTKKAPTLLILNLLIIGLVALGVGLLNKSTTINVKASALNVRTGPGLDYGVSSQVKSGTKLAVISQKNEWYKVTLPDGKTGWVASWLIGNTKTTPVTNIDAVITEDTPLREGPEDKSTVLTTLTKDTKVTITLEQNGWSQVELKDQAGWVQTSHVKESTEEENISEKTDDNLIYTREVSTNLRKEPQISGELVTTLTENTPVTVLETVDDWYKVETSDGQVGYVASWVMNTQPRSKNTLVTSISEATIMIDAGHGGDDVGASTSNNIREKDLTLSTAKILKATLEKTGARVLMTRDDDSWVELTDRSDLSNKEKPDVFISIHYDATEDQNIASGTHTFYYHDDDKKLAETIASYLDQLPLENHGASFNDLSVTRENNQPALLLELGYVSTNKDVTHIITKDYQQQAADLITQGLTEYFK